MSDITKLEPRLLLAFVAIYQECSVTRAAMRLNITQQGLSGTLARLRDVFDDPLFVRIPHGVSPTPFSETIYPKVNAAIEGLKSLTQIEAFDPGTIASTFCVAANDYALSVVIEPLFRHLRDVAPKLKLAAVPLQIELLNDQMRNGHVDLALTVPEFLPDNLHAATLFSDHYKCVFRKGHPLATQKLTINGACCTDKIVAVFSAFSLTRVTMDALQIQRCTSRQISQSTVPCHELVFIQ